MGDEGNLHAPQTLEAITEVMQVMNVKNCIMNAQTNKPIIGVVYDALSGSYLLTQNETRVDIDTYMDCLMLMTARSQLASLEQRLTKFGIPSRVYYYLDNNGQPIYVTAEQATQIQIEVTKLVEQAEQARITQQTQLAKELEARQIYLRSFVPGRVLFSALLPEDFYYSKGDVYIINGILINGTITKDHIGTSHGSIIQALWKDYGRDRTVDFLTDVPFVVNRWLTDRPLTVGLKDCYPKDETHRQLLAEEIAKTTLSVQALGTRLADPVEEERHEKQVIGYLHAAKNIGSRISTEKLTPDNSLRVMAESGAKGSTSNIAQITGLLGQQFIKGSQRMPMSLSGGTRCLPYFEKEEIDPRARGFCVGSFLSGLTPAELFFHQASGREGLMDTAVKTSETGSIHHRIIKALEDIKVAYDGSVRNAVGTVFQFVYGEDGFDAAELEKVKTVSGDTTSFIDLKRTVGRLNARYGFHKLPSTTKTDKKLDVEEQEIEREFSYEEEVDLDMAEVEVDND